MTAEADKLDGKNHRKRSFKPCWNYSCGYVSGVMPYGERLQKKGLNLLSAPGNDLVAATTLAASGCHMVLFTTGRGTPFGTFIVVLLYFILDDL